MKWFETTIGETQVTGCAWTLIEANTAIEALKIAYELWCQDYPGRNPGYMESKLYPHDIVKNQS
jgi:hypothetical protein